MYNLISKEVFMYLLDSIKIDGFREKHTVGIAFHSDINFLIGENGSGKTTILKIVLGILSANYVSLSSLPFKKAQLKLRNKQDKRMAEISINVEKSCEKIFFQILKNNKKIFGFEINMDSKLLRNSDFYENRRGFPVNRWELERNYFFNKKMKEVEEEIRKYVEFDDLSVERLSFNISSVRERERDTSIDRILGEVVHGLVGYFKNLSLTATQADSALKELYVMSLLTSPKSSYSQQSLSASVMAEKLANILKTFSVSKSKYQKVLEDFLTTYRFEEQQQKMGPDSIRMKQIVDRYDEVEKKKKEIFAPKDMFLEVVNKLLKNKQMQYQELGEHEDSLRIIQENQQVLNYTHLSSGEKHLLILLGTTLLQKNQPRIFIADEPEISLHIQWQRELVGAIRRLNQNAQIIFATHSPEIVAGYSQKLHELKGE